MATETLNAGLGEIRIAAASKGAALTTTASVTQLIPWTQYLILSPRNFSAAVVAKIAFNPWLYILKTIDGFASAPINYSLNAQDNSTGTSVDLSVLGLVTSDDFVMVGSHLPFRGLQIDVDGTNAAGTANVAMTYWNGSALTDLSVTDGTDSTATLDQDGAMTWTVPADWTPGTLEDIIPASSGVAMTSKGFVGRREKLYWIQWGVSAALTDTSVTLDSICALNRSTAYAELLPGQTLEERIKHGPGGIGCIEHLTDAGTANLIVNCAMLSGGSFK